MTTHEMLLKAQTAKPALQAAGEQGRTNALLAMADSLLAHTADILAANARDMEAAKGTMSDVMLDRLLLDKGRIAGMAQGGGGGPAGPGGEGPAPGGAAQRPGDRAGQRAHGRGGHHL